MKHNSLHFFLLALSAATVCNGQAFDFTTEQGNCLCSCGQSVCDLVEFVRKLEEKLSVTTEEIKGLLGLHNDVNELDKRLIVASGEIVGLVGLHNTFRSFQSRTNVELREMRTIIKKLSKQIDSNKNPTSESLVLPPEAMISTAIPIMADEAAKMTENFTTLIEDKFKEVSSLSSEVTELQQENKVLKEKMEEEKRVRRSLQHQVYFVEERLNQTHSWVLEINEKVSDKDSENSTVEEVAEIVFAKIAEFDVLNKTAIENQLKKLEYTVKDAFKNETQLAQRLDSVENASAYTTGLLANGTLIDQVHNIASTIRTLGNVQSQHSDVMNQLELQMNEVNNSLTQKIKEVQYTVSMMDLSVNETMLSFENELSKINDTWNEQSLIIDKTFMTIDERISESNALTGRALNTTKDVEIFFKSLYEEALNNISAVKEEMTETQVRLRELIQLPGELVNVKSILNRTVARDELYDLWNNATEQSKFLEEKAFLSYANLNEIINKTEEKIAAMESKYRKDNDLIKQNLSDFSAQEQEAKERLNSLRVELENLILNQTGVFSVLQSRLENLSSKMEEMDQENEFRVSSIVYNVSKLRDLQLESELTMQRSFEIMELLLVKKMDFHKEELADLINKLDTYINSTTKTEEIVTDGDEDFLSRAKIGSNESSTEATTDAPLPCHYAPLETDGEVVVAYLRDAVFEELSRENWIPHGEQLFFSCKKIGRFILNGEHTLTCVNGQWSDEFPECEKLLDESIVRDASQDEGDPCLEPRGQFPDPSNCRFYFNCWDGTKRRQMCQNGLHFNAGTKKCDFVNSANCTVNQANRKVDQLEDIIPPIDFAPLGVDVANSLLSTSITGKLVAYPGVNLNLICLYPRRLGEPQWEIMEETSHPHLPAWDTKGVANINHAYKLKLHLSALSAEYSGNYTCVTPKGRRHTIRLHVKAVTCPDFDVDPGSHVTVTYRPSPEGLQRVLTTQVSFDCPRGYSLNGSNTATCKASGSWSQDLPTCTEEKISGCWKPDLNNRPGLYLDPDKPTYNFGDPIYFKCKGQLSLMGITSARCGSDGTWTIRNGLPDCQ